MPKRKTTTTEEEITAEQATEVAADEGKPKEAPLFPSASRDWVSVQVERIDPSEEEGYLGRLPITSTEQDIRGRWGGGRYMIRAVNASGHYKQQRTLSIAGDPVFVSEVAEQRWRRGLGNRSPLSPAAAAAPAQQFGVAEIVSLFQGMQAMQSAQQQAWAQQQAEERRAREADDRRRDDERRADERRREDQRAAEERQREERRAAEEERSRQRDREFMNTMINVVSAKPAGGEQGMIQAFTSGLTLALKLRPADSGRDDDDDEEEGGEDPISETVRGLVRGLGDTLTGRAAAPSSSESPAAPPGGPEPVTLTGPLAAQVTDFVHRAKASGRNPEALIASAVDVMSKKLPGNGAVNTSAAMTAVKAGEGKTPPAAS